VDLALIALPAPAVPDAVAGCVEADVRAVVIAASGFAERSLEGQRLQEEIVRIGSRAGLRILGPNCFGLFVAPTGVNLTPIRDIPRGSVALVTQSGNVAIALFVQARRAGIGFAACVGVGNQSDVAVGELFTHLATDPSSAVVACYVEGLPEGTGQALYDGLIACRDARKPVVIFKAGRSDQGAAAASTHTGSLAADDRLWDAVLNETGAVRVGSAEEMVDVLAAVLRVPPRQGNRVMVLSYGGGDSVMSTDALAESGLSLARPLASTREALERLTPRDAPRALNGNPVTLDTAGGVDEDPELLLRCVEVLAREPNVDIILIAGQFGGYHHLRDQELACAQGLLAARSRGLPIVMQSAFALENEEPLELLKAHGIPVYPTVLRLVRALAAAARSGGTPPQTPAMAATEASSTTRLLDIRETARLLSEYRIAVPSLTVVADETALREAVDRTGLPVCVKLADPDVAHRSDVGGVRLDLADAEAAREAARDLWARFPRAPLLVMPMLARGFELIAGITTDPVFGPAVLVGRGGVWAELEEDVVLRLAPVTVSEAEEMLRRLRCAPMLLGGRGQAPLDVAGCAGVLAALSRMAVDNPGLTLEMNPVFVYAKGYAAADLRGRRS
jgi:acetyltransferase